MWGSVGGKERLSISIDLAAGRKIKLLSAGSSCCKKTVTGALLNWDPETHEAKCVCVCLCACVTLLVKPGVSCDLKKKKECCETVTVAPTSENLLCL